MSLAKCPRCQGHLYNEYSDTVCLNCGNREEFDMELEPPQDQEDQRESAIPNSSSVETVLTKVDDLRDGSTRPQKPRRRSTVRLYDSEEQRRAEEASRLRASDRLVTDEVEGFRSDVWGTPAPPFSDSSAASSWLRGKVYVYQHTGDALGGGPLLSPGEEVKFEYVGGLLLDRVESMAVPRDSVLGRLQQAAGSLSGRLNCFPPQALEFVLAGKPPIVMPITADLGWGRTTLYVNYPWVKPESVRRFHARIQGLWRRSAKRQPRVGLGEQRDDDARRLAEQPPRSRELLEFDLSTPGLSSKNRYIAWNRKYPGHHKSKESLEASLSRAKRRLDPFDFDGLTLTMYARKGYIRFFR